MRQTSSPLPEDSNFQTPTTGRGRAGTDAGFAFGGFLLQPDGTLLRGKTIVHLPPKELTALRLLLVHKGQIVSPIQLRQTLWGDVHVTADSVPKCLSSLRARLEPEKPIQTVYKRGYRFIAEVRRHDATAGDGLPRLAILPFEPGYSVPDHLVSAIAEETIARLTAEPYHIADILARDSVFTLAQRGLTALQIGETLKADLVLTGTLRALTSHFRLRAEMIRVEDGIQLWVEDMLVPRSPITGLETELVNRLVSRLQGGFAAEFHRVPAPTPAWNLQVPGELAFLAGGAEQALVPEARRQEAYEIFQRAHYEWQTMQRHRMQDGLQHLLRAIELDPTLIAARVDLANLCVTQAFYGYMSPAVAAGNIHFATDWDSTKLRNRGPQESVQAVSKSMRHLPQLTEAMLPAAGWISFHVDHDLPSAIKAFSQSAHLPHDPWTTRLRVMMALSRHRFHEAIEMLHAAIYFDPFSPWLHARMAWALHLGGQSDESISRINSALALFPDHESPNLYGAIILAFTGEAARATLLAEALVRRLPYSDIATAVHAYALACGGRADEARANLDRLQWLSRERFVLNSFTPAVHVALGEMDCALAELRVSADARCPWFFQMLADPRLRPLLGRPEFEQMRELLTRMEFEAQVSTLER